MDIRTRILDAAVRVFAENGYRGATTRRIAQMADVNEVTLFRHFGSKDELVREALQQIELDMAQAALPEQPADPERELTRWAQAHHDQLVKLAPVIRTCMGECAEHPEMAQCAQNHPLRVATELRTYLTHLQALGLADNDVDVGSATGLLIGALFNDAIGRAVMPDLFSYPAEQAATRYVTLFLRAIGAPAAARKTTSKARSQ